MLTGQHSGFSLLVLKRIRGGNKDRIESLICIEMPITCIGFVDRVDRGKFTG
jgi:hypothetical protein